MAYPENDTFKEAVQRLHRLANQPSPDRIAVESRTAMKISPSTVADWVRGSTVPRDVSQFLAVVDALARLAQRSGKRVPEELSHHEAWKRRIEQARSNRNQRPRPSPPTAPSADQPEPESAAELDLPVDDEYSDQEVPSPVVMPTFIIPHGVSVAVRPTFLESRKIYAPLGPNSSLGIRLAFRVRQLLLRSAFPEEHLGELVIESLHAYLNWQNPDGGWSSIPGAMSNSWSTAQAVYLLNELDHVGYRVQVNRAVDWLLEHRHEDGGWGLQQGVSDVTGVELVIFALSSYRDQRTQRLLKKAANWLIDKQNSDDSGWAFVPRSCDSSAYCTAWAMISLHALAAAAAYPIYQKVYVERGKKFLANSMSRNWRDHGWGKFLGSPTEGMRTAHSLNGLFAADARNSRIFKRGLRALCNEQLKDGGWGDDGGSTLEGTCWALIALARTGQFNFLRPMSRAIEFCLRSRDRLTGGWPERAGGPVQIWCTHHAIIALCSYLNVCRSFDQAPLHRLVRWWLKGQLLRPAMTSKIQFLTVILISLGIASTIFCLGS